LVATRARLITEESTRASADTALATRATTLEAQVANTAGSGLQSRISTEESARASADAALATRATALEARSYVKGNQVRGSRPNYDSSNPNNLFSRFGYVFQGLWNVGTSPYVDGPYFSQSLTSASGYSWNAMLSNAFPVVVGTTISAQAMLAKFGTFNAGTIRLVVYWYSDTAGLTVVSQAANKSWESGTVVAGQNTSLARWVDLPNLLVPSGIQSARIGIWTDNVTGDGVYTEAAAWMLKAEYGSTCTAWTDDAMVVDVDARVRTEESARASADSAIASSVTTLSATVGTNTSNIAVNAAAIATINDSAAFYQILVAASSGDPALIRLFSGLGGSEVAIAAKILSLVNTTDGSAMEVMLAIGGLAFFRRQISADSSGRRVTIGPGFGVSGSQVVLWFGPDTIAPDSQSRTNGYFALGTDGIIYYGSAVLGSPVSAVRKVDFNPNGTGNNNSWQTIATVNFPNCPGGNVYMDGSFYVVSTGTGTCDHKARITIDGILAGSELASQTTVVGGTPNATDFSELFGQILAVSSGNRTIAFQLQRTFGTGNIDIGDAYFDVKAFPV
jgi:hypothetical protein